MKKSFFSLISLFSIILAVSTFLIPNFTQAENNEIIPDKENIYKAKVIQIFEEKESEILETGVKNNYQKIEVEILTGEKKGEKITVENDYLNLKKGETFYLMESIHDDGDTLHYSVHDKYRLPVLYFFIVLFVICVVIFGGSQGIRGLVSLIGSMLLIGFVLIPNILAGYSPILLTICVSSLIIILGSYITHGFNKTTSSAVIGMITTVIFTGALAYFAVDLAGLSGFESEEAVYLNFNTGGKIDFVGLLFGGIIIGLLGVLYDVSIGQAVSVEELREAGKDLTRKEIFKRALRIGKEHTGALVNTLAIAYVGASLPLLLLFYNNSGGSFNEIINREIFATEIIRTIIGSIGLVLAVPITTAISVFMLVKNKD